MIWQWTVKIPPRRPEENHWNTAKVCLLTIGSLQDKNSTPAVQWHRSGVLNTNGPWKSVTLV